MDESTHATSQRSTFIHGVLRNVTIVEKIVSIFALKGTTRDYDLYTYLTDALGKSDSPISLIFKSLNHLYLSTYS